ncbi:TRAM domain-containing protein [Candidatus Woesearchaeota archaeon]|nr:TRAM domain-containing protein [Candidatus Woesearchaeota archaeon]
MERDFRQSRGFMAPVKVGDEIDVKIEAVGEKGDGIAKKDGFVIFVPNTKEGDEVKVKVTRVLRRVGFGEVVGEGSAPAGEEAPSEEAPAEESSPEEEPKEDSEDFGDESGEDQEEEKEE